MGMLLLLLLSGCVSEKIPAEKKFWVPRDPPGAEYVIEARVTQRGEAMTAEGKASISLVNRSNQPLSILAIEWVLTPGQPLELQSGGQPLRLLNPSRNLPLSTPLFYELPEPVRPGKKVRLEARFTYVAAQRGDPVLLQSWYPQLWWEGIPVRNAFRVKLEVPSGYELAVSGRLDRKSGYYENDSVTTRFGLGLFRSAEKEVRESRGVLITTIFHEKEKDCALFCLEAAADILAFYKDWLGFYPHQSLTIIPGGPKPWGGYPFASGIVVIHGQETFDASKPAPEQTWWKWITAHEIGHQYWGEYVMPDDVQGHYTDSWLMIGLGICADKKYMLDRRLGWERHRDFINRYFRGVRERNETTLDAPPSLQRIQKYDRNNILIHGKGFATLSALEAVLGSEVFDRLYRKILATYGGKRLGWRDFRRLAELESGENLNWFFEDWVRTNRALECQVTGQTSAKEESGFLHEVRVEYGLDSIRMPVPVQAIFEDGTSEVQWTDRLTRVQTLQFRSSSPLREVKIDPEGKLAVMEDVLPRTAEELEEFLTDMEWTGTGGLALEIFKRPETASIQNSRMWFKLALLLYDGGFYGESCQAFERASRLDSSDLNLFSCLTWMGHLKDLLGEREEAVVFYKEALKHDVGQTIRHDQYGIQINRAWLEERLKRPFQGGR